MIFFPDGKTFLEINLGSFHLSIAWYAILILSGAFLAYFLSVRQMKKLGYKSEVMEDWFVTMLPLSIIGARIWYVIFEWYRYANNPISAFYIWEGGLAIQGGLIVGIIYSWFFFRKRGINFLRLADCVMPNVLLAQAIGRWGNFFNQEAYGNIVDAKYYQYFPDFFKHQMFIDGHFRQPMFLIEGVGNVIGWLLITLVYRKHGRKKRGDLFYAYLCWYGVVRYIVEASRSDSLMFNGLKVAQMLSILFIILGALGIMGFYDRWFKYRWPFAHEVPTILFDFDGTLADSYAIIKESFKYTFKQFPLPYEVSDETIKSYFGPPLRDSFLKHYQADQIEAVLKCYRDYNAKLHDRLKPMPNALELLKDLKENDYEMAIVSSKLTDTVKLGMQVTGIDQYIDVIVGKTKELPCKPDPAQLIKACELLKVSHDDLIYVGDSIYDIEAANNMAAYSIALYDDTNREMLAAAKPCLMINSLSELKDIVRQDREWDQLV